MSRWIDPRPVHVPQEIRQVAGDDLLAELLVRRGIADADRAREFLDPTLYTPAPPETLPDLIVAVERLERAIAAHEPIAIWGDFDVDGQTATALYLDALRELGAKVRFYIPTRRESHGMHLPGVQRLIDQGVRLLLSADTGIAAEAAIALAATHGVDVLVTDHHDLPPTLPDALALVNPRRLPPVHPLYELSGVGVAYQVACALYARAGRADAERLLDLVALGIVADVVPIYADVRYLLQRGLDVLRGTSRPGLLTMMALADLTPQLLTEEDISFALAPRLNALSRVSSPSTAVDGRTEAALGVELLTTTDRTRARTIAYALESLNARRKLLTRQTTEDALEQLERDRSLMDGPAIVVAGANWDPGIVGIVAGRLAERFHRPAVVFSAPPGEIARGSARSIAGVDIHAAIAAQKHLLYRCGGHPMAAGLSLESARIPEFRRALWRTLEQMVPVIPEREIAIDAYLPLDQVSLALAEKVGRMAPFGPGNARPVFATQRLELVSAAIIGRTREHRRLTVRDADGNERMVFWWRSADQQLPVGEFDLAYTVGVNVFRGQAQVQITWVDARPVAPSTPVEVRPRPAIHVYDYRNLPGDAEALRVLHTLMQEHPSDMLIWAEGGMSPSDARSVGRSRLGPTGLLVIWNAPPGPAELRDALKAASPAQVAIFGLDPGLDTLKAFLHRLAGLVKYALQKRGGNVALADLAEAMAHTEWAVRLGLEWLAHRGQIAVTFAQDGWVTFEKGDGTAAAADMTTGRLRAQLEETAAYRAYFRRTDVRWLI